MNKLHNIKNFDDPKSHSPVLNYALHANSMRSIRIPFPLTPMNIEKRIPHQHTKGYKNKIIHKKPNSSDYLQKPSYIPNSLT